MKSIKFLLVLFLLLFVCVAFAEEVSMESIIGKVPNKQIKKPLKIKGDVFFIGGGAIQGKYAEGTIKLIRKYNPNIAFIAHTEAPSNTQTVNDITKFGVPVFYQTWGPSFKPYLVANDALEHSWGGVDLNKNTPDSSSHSLSMPNKASREIWSNYLKSSIYNGASGIVYCDQVQGWMLGRGSSGHNSQSIASYIEDLRGTDTGVDVKINGVVKNFKFKDYVEFYMGKMPLPKDLGFSSWDEYKPITKKEYDPEGFKEKYIINNTNSELYYFDVDEATKKGYTPKFLMHDMLFHYEYLKYCDFMGKKAKEYGGLYNAMPNAEDLANGVDMYFLSSLVDVNIVSEEYFQSPAFLDAAYMKEGYLTSNLFTIPNKRFGYVLESGGGGNDWPYYEHEVSYLTAYEGKFACNTSVLEGDFWPSLHAHLDQNNYRLKEYLDSGEYIQERCKAILSYANGFKYASVDKAKKLDSDFTSVVARRIFRPWGREYATYAWKFNDPNADFLPEQMLFDNGYVFNTVGMEATKFIKPQKLVSYTVNTPTRESFGSMLSKIRSGHVKNTIFVAEGLTNMLNYDFNIVKLDKYYTDFKVKVENNNISGRVLSKEFNIDKDYKLLGDVYSISGFEPVVKIGDTPIVAKKKIGKGNVYVLLFNPNTNKDLGLAVYKAIFDKLNINQKWLPIDNSTARIYKDKAGLIVSVRNKILNMNEWGAFYNNTNPMEKRCKYLINAPTSVDIVLEPNKKYYAYSYLSPEIIEINTNNKGVARLTMKDKTLGIFFIRKTKSLSLLSELQDRDKEFSDLKSFK